MVNSGIAANLLGQDLTSLRRPGSPLGGLLESFVAMELARQLTWADTRAELSEIPSHADQRAMAARLIGPAITYPYDLPLPPEAR